VTVIDVASNTVTTTIPVGTNPFIVAIDSGGAHAYVSALGTDDVTIIDIATLTAVGSVSVGMDPRGIAVLP
jgi:YVTN family beta-propeller protein